MLKHWEDGTPYLECDKCGHEITEEYAQKNGGLIMVGNEHLHWECCDNPPPRGIGLIEDIIDDAVSRLEDDSGEDEGHWAEEDGDWRD